MGYVHENRTDGWIGKEVDPLQQQVKENEPQNEADPFSVGLPERSNC
jgi:hypothetical protein